MEKVREQNASWEELNDLHNRSKAAFSIPAVLPTVLRDKEVIARLGDKLPKINEMVSQVHKDTEDARDKLQAIYSQHEGKKGGHNDPNVMAELITIGNSYVEWTEDFENKVINGVKDILALANNDATEENKVVTGIEELDKGESND